MILRAAISNYQDSRGRRQGKGYWREFIAVTYKDASSTKDVMYVKEMGASMPAAGVTSYLKGAGGQPSLSATGRLDADGDNLPQRDDLPDLDALQIEESASSTWPVWLYGNWWADSEPKGGSDQSHLRLVGIGARFGRSQSHLDTFGLKPGDVGLRGSSIGLCTADDSNMFKHIPGRKREMQSDSETAFRRIEAWLDNCRLHHPSCRSPPISPQLPTRVIDVSVTDREVALFESNGQRGRYMALSHCWGASSRLTTTKDTLEDLKNGIATSFLPKTFQDAIKITRRLGVKYLWIDCFCIVQDDPLDWERESSAMAQIYRNSYLTIAASASSDSYSGCFPKRSKDSYIPPGTRSLGYTTPREASGPRSHTLGLEHSSQPGNQQLLHFFEEWLPGSSIHAPQKTQIGHFGKRFDPIADEPLSSRGWTLQERLLSPRIVHYAADQMYFECEWRLRSEDGFEFPDMFFSMGNLLATQRIPFEQHGLAQASGISFVVGRHPTMPYPGKRWKGGWISLVENYSRRLLKVSQDKLSAVAGVARVIAEETGDHYFAGLWAQHLEEDLHWRVYTHDEHFEKGDTGREERPVKGKLIGAAVKPATYRAPSWSWASIDAPIKFIPLSYGNLVAEIKDCYAKPAGVDNFGRVSAGKLDIRAPVYEIKSHKPKSTWKRHGIPVEIDLGDERGICIGAIHLDQPDEPLPFPCYALFLDPENALIIRSQDLEPERDSQGNEIAGKLIPKPILTTEDINRSLREPLKELNTFWLRGDENSDDPEKRAPRAVQVPAEELRILSEMTGKPYQLHKSLNDAVRIGVGAFLKYREEAEGKKSRPYNREVDGELTLDKVLNVRSGETWGQVPKDAQRFQIILVITDGKVAEIPAILEPIPDYGFFGSNHELNIAPLNGIDDATMQGQDLDLTIPYLHGSPETNGWSRAFENENSQVTGLPPEPNSLATGFTSLLNDRNEDLWDLPISLLNSPVGNGTPAAVRETHEKRNLPVPMETAQQLAELFLDIGKHIATVPPLSIHDCLEAYNVSLAANGAPNDGPTTNTRREPLFALKTTFQLTQTLINLYPRVQKTNLRVPLTSAGSNFGANRLEAAENDPRSEQRGQSSFSTSETLDHASVLQLFSCHHRLIDTWDLIFSHVHKGIESGKMGRSLGEGSPCQRLRIGGFVPSTKVPLEVVLSIEFLRQLLVQARGLVGQITSMQHTEQPAVGGCVGGDDSRAASDANIEATKSAGMAVISRAGILVQKTYRIRDLIEEATRD
ncbi:hypothetical protein FQN54_003654 [Arachnomyces sp. PD_36]|nr:hypothetical protein FQN54_003654 [Arachnomyces sp. PD_36]